MAALFIDLKAAFNSVDRKILVKTMRERRIRERLIVRIEEMLRETRSRLRIRKEVGENFWARGVRQECPLSPLLFNLLIADIEKEMGKVKWGGVKVGKSKIYTLAYADDVVLMTEEEEEMRSMMKRLKMYLERKNLKLNTEKTKIIRFRKGGERWEKRI